MATQRLQIISLTVIGGLIVDFQSDVLGDADLPTVASVTPGSYTTANITVDAYGRVTAAATGSGGGGVTSVNTRTGAVTIVDTDIPGVTTGTVSTTDGTTTTILTIPIPSNQTTQLWVEVIGHRTGGLSGTTGDSTHQIFADSFKNISGTVTRNGNPPPSNPVTIMNRADDNIAVPTGSISISGTNALVQVTGGSSRNYNWYARCKATSLS